jgi:hypothetical protein
LAANGAAVDAPKTQSARGGNKWAGGAAPIGGVLPVADSFSLRLISAIPRYDFSDTTAATDAVAPTEATTAASPQPPPAAAAAVTKRTRAPPLPPTANPLSPLARVVRRTAFAGEEDAESAMPAAAVPVTPASPLIKSPAPKKGRGTAGLRVVSSSATNALSAAGGGGVSAKARVASVRVKKPSASVEDDE